MTAAVSRAVMSLAGRCLGGDRRDWGLAMQAEFEAAVDDGRPFAFAAGCLIAAWREMVNHGEGRLVLANYALVLGLMLPMAALQFEQVIGISMFPEGAPPHAMLVAGAGQNLYLVSAQNSAVPVLLMLWLLLGLAHLCLAWVLVDWDWPRAVKFGALIGAIMVTLFLFMGVLMLDLSSLITQAAELGIELAAILATARWYGRLFSHASPELLAW